MNVVAWVCKDTEPECLLAGASLCARASARSRALMGRRVSAGGRVELACACMCMSARVHACV
eukprot:1959300-Pleurochrysis_carterae.AAC.1